MSKVYSFKLLQKIPGTMEETWAFFSNPKNLPLITPPALGFKIISGEPAGNMHPGQLIEYTVKPMPGIPLYWMTEITAVAEYKYFVDEQRFGPYSLWHHQHHFRQMNGYVEMTDIVHYKIPGWFLGDIANTLFVNRQLKGIFDYRFNAVEKLFSK